MLLSKILTCTALLGLAQGQGQRPPQAQQQQQLGCPAQMAGVPTGNPSITSSTACPGGEIHGRFIITVYIPQLIVLQPMEWRTKPTMGSLFIFSVVQ